MDGEYFPDIVSFYGNRSIFVTGATGFIGKVLLEKLLRACPGIKRIYILVRKKNDKDMKQRLEELFSSKAFDLLQNETPEVMHKIVGIAGDVSLPDLGISNEDIDLLTSEVSVVFHGAANVKFNETLKKVINVNALGTKYCIQLCHKMPHLVAFVHISTAYSNCNRKEIEEIVYPFPVPPNQIIDRVKWMDEENLVSLTAQLIGDWPNAYTYSKALAEALLVEECGCLPVVIIRPSIVVSSWKEPYPGWVDNMNGLTGLLVAYSKGLLRNMLVKSEMAADLIPVDMVVNLMIAVACYTAVHNSKGAKVYHCVSGTLNKITWKYLVDTLHDLILLYPSEEVFRYPLFRCVQNRRMLWIFKVYDHYLPAFFLDLLARALCKKAQLLRIYRKLHVALRHMEYFTTQEWSFHCNNVLQLNDLLSKQDREKFFVDITNMNWFYFWENYVLGFRKYVLKEDPATIPTARNKLRRKLCFSMQIRRNN